MNEYYVHDSTRHLVLLAHGCENHIEDTSNIYYNTDIVRNIVRQIDNGRLSDSGFYPAFSIFNIGDLNASRVIKISQFIDSVNALTAGGRVQWKSLTQIYNIWNTTYNKKPYYVMCEDIPLSVSLISNEVPNGYVLEQNYPNPFNPNTVINFSIPEKSFVELKIYDLKGSLIEVLTSKELSPGSYSAYWNAENFSSGIYFYSIITKDFTQTKKMILLK